MWDVYFLSFFLFSGLRLEQKNSLENMPSSHPYLELLFYFFLYKSAAENTAARRSVLLAELC